MFLVTRGRSSRSTPAARGGAGAGGALPVSGVSNKGGRGPRAGPPHSHDERYIARQLVQLAVVIVGISMLAFAILHVIGDPVTLLLPQNAGKEEYARYHKLLGLDQPVYVQYWKFASRAVQGDFGKSWYADTPAFKLVIERMPPTLYLTFAGLVDGAPDLAAARHPRRAQAPLAAWTACARWWRWRARPCRSSGSASC